MTSKPSRRVEVEPGEGRVYWFTGLAGVGKSTLGGLFAERLRRIKPNVVFLDGDEIRAVWGGQMGYKREDRLKAAHRYSRLCQLFARQGLDVVCATISLFHDCQSWNRDNIPNYCEILVSTSPQVLLTRNRDHLYIAEDEKQSRNVVGVDILPEFPLQPDVVIENDGTLNPEAIVDKIWATISEEHRAQ